MGKGSCGPKTGRADPKVWESLPADDEEQQIKPTVLGRPTHIKPVVT